MKTQITAILLVLSSISLQAQDYKSTTAGFSVALNGAYGSWDSESAFIGSLDDEEPAGFGLGVKLGYGITQKIEVFIAYSSLGFKREFSWNSYQLNALQLGGRFNFGATLRRVRPFLEAALSYQAFTIDPIAFENDPSVYILEMDGLGGSLGGGLHVFLLPQLSATGLFRASFGNFSEASLSGTQVNNLLEKLDFTIVSAHIGLSYFFD